MKSLRPFFEWCDHTSIAQAIRDSRILFPVIESIHLLALAVLLGAILVLNLRLLKKVLTTQTLAAVAESLAPLTIGGLAVMIASGSLLFASEALKCYESPPFRCKMILLAAAIVFQWIVARPVTRTVPEPGRFRSAATALVSLILWFGVGAAGRAIGFY
jgi:hypothetical protein